MEIRRLQESDDRRQLSRIYEQSWKYAYRGIVPSSYLDSIPEGRWADWRGRDTLVAVDGGALVGTASVCPSRFPDKEGYGEIVSIYFLPDYMGKGYGGALLRAAVEALASMGYRDIFLWVLEENRRARRFYEKHGFRADGGVMVQEIGGKALRERRYAVSVSHCPVSRETKGGIAPSDLSQFII